MKRSISPKELAKAIGASESSIKRWCDNGLIIASYTPGGHRKIDVHEALQFLRTSRHELQLPEQLGLPATIGRKTWTDQEAVEALLDAFVNQQEDSATALVMDLYLSGRSLSNLFDDVLGIVFATIGNEWKCGNLDIHKERQACQMCRRIMDRLRQLTKAQNPQRTAIGGTFVDDHYELPTLMIEVALRDQGWNAMSLGTNLPVAAFCRAIDEHCPELVWLSVSHVTDSEQLIASANRLWDQLDRKVPLIVGGRALTEGLRREIRCTVHCDSIGQLEDFLQSYHRNRSGSEANPSLN